MAVPSIKPASEDAAGWQSGTELRHAAWSPAAGFTPALCHVAANYLPTLSICFIPGETRLRGPLRRLKEIMTCFKTAPFKGLLLQNTKVF